MRMPTKSETISSLIGCLIIMSIAIGLLFMTIKPIKECESRGWDGSGYSTGVREIKLFQESEEIVVKCSKAPKETDAMIDILDALPFVKIKQDVNVSGDEQ